LQTGTVALPITAARCPLGGQQVDRSGHREDRIAPGDWREVSMLRFLIGMICSENRFTLFRIML
jgi:hypothetical protein